MSGFLQKTGAGNETRTRDPNLGKVVLYQLSYSRVSMDVHSNQVGSCVKLKTRRGGLMRWFSAA